MAQDDFVAGMRRQVGWFVMLGIGVLLFVLMITSIRTDVFANKMLVYFSPPSASSIYEGQPVKFQGFAIGKVDNIELNAKGQVRVAMQLLEKYRGMIHRDAVARTVKEGFIGEQIIEVTSGSDQQPVISDGDELNYESEASVEQLLADLKPAVNNANILLRELSQLSVWMNDPYGDVRVGTAGLRQLAEGVQGVKLKTLFAQLSESVGQLQRFSGELNRQQVAKSLGASLSAMAKVLKELEPFAEAMGRHGEATVDQMQSMMRNVDQLSASLNVVTGDLAELTPELPELAQQSQETIEEIRALVRSLRNSWLVGGSSDKKEGRDSADVAPPALDIRP